MARDGTRSMISLHTNSEHIDTYIGSLSSEQSCWKKKHLNFTLGLDCKERDSDSIRHAKLPAKKGTASRQGPRRSRARGRCAPPVCGWIMGFQEAFFPYTTRTINVTVGSVLFWFHGKTRQAEPMQLPFSEIASPYDLALGFACTAAVPWSDCCALYRAPWRGHGPRCGPGW